MKRDDESPYTSVEKADLPVAAWVYLKREFSEDKRKELADKGHALPDGSYPIENKGDLKNAIQAVGRAKNPAKAKAHIKARAKDLGASDMLPDTWSKRDDDNVIDMTGLLRKNAVDFDTSLENQETGEDAGEMMQELNECLCALGCAVNSILWDETVTDKSAAIEESFNQFKDYVAGLTPATLEKTMNAEVKKQIDEAVAAALKDTTDRVTKAEAENAALKDQIAFLSMPVEHQEFAKAMSPEDKKKFAAKDKKGQQEEMDEAKKRAAQTIDPAIKKRLDEADEDRKVLKQLQEKDEITTFAKRAVELGLPEGDGEMLRKAHHGDAASLKAVEDKLGQLNKQLSEFAKTGKIFTEFGTKIEKTGTTAIDQLNAKADELRKSEAGKGLSPAQAFAKVYADPANAELAALEKRERNAKIGVAA
ncbi:MAG TPA: hypothetical protein VMT89_07160 [Candidatus Acidoferrales bacterium]|nr:hypothetical protein [Candidatus Acidoferrales bacterium]